MHSDEVDTDVALARRLVAAQLPHWSALPLEEVAERGTDNALYRLAEDMVVRLPRTEPTNERLVKEREWLPLLAPAEPLAAGEPGEGYPFTWSVYSWLEGESATPDRVRDERELAGDLVRLIRALWEIDARDGPPPGPHNAFRGVPLAARDASVRASIAALGDAVDAGAVTAAWEASLAAPEWDEAPLWLHGDLDSRNLLARDGRLSAVLDWGCLGIGDPSCDVMVAWKMLGGEAREAFRRELGVDDATWERSRGWALSQALIALAYYTLETNRVLVVEAQRWLAAVTD